jgi:putative DNA methylase
VRDQLKARHGGAKDARLFCVVTTQPSEQGRYYRLPTDEDRRAVHEATTKLEQGIRQHSGPLSLVPDERIDVRGIRHTWAMIYGIDTWGDMFLPRQSLALTTLCRLLSDAYRPRKNDDLSIPIQVCLALAIDRQANSLTSLSRWNGEKIEGVFARQAIPLLWDFAEVNPFSGATGDFDGAIEWVLKVCDANAFLTGAEGHAVAASATHHPLADSSCDAFVTDPPYYDAVPYAYLSDFFYVWLRRSLSNLDFDLLRGEAVPKEDEIVVDRPHELSNSTHDIHFYERALAQAFREGRRILRSDGIATIVFASKTTASWEAILKAVIDSGWIITGSWPIDTEMESRIAAAGQARLASSVHLVCRSRQNVNSTKKITEIGDWRDVLQELPRRIHEWMPRLAHEGVVGADAIFACLGPAPEIFSRYLRVEKANGEVVALKEYLEQVWAAVAKEALTMIFTGADTTGFEEDARLTAMWLWTLNAGNNVANTDSADENDTEADDVPESGTKKPKVTGFVLEYDAARKIAQGLGAHLEDLGSLVEVSGEVARLLPVGERARHLFGKDQGNVAPGKKKKVVQPDLFKVLEQAGESEATFGEAIVEHKGKTVLDRIHQSMILFAAGRSEALKRFFVEEGVGRDPRFWSLAQALSALYPTSTSEKRWIDGVLARKKGLGF